MNVSTMFSYHRPHVPAGPGPTALLAVLLLLCACNQPAGSGAASPIPSVEPISTARMGSAHPHTPQVEDSQAATAAAPPVSGKIGYTHIGPDGNRFLPGSGSLPAASPLDIPLEGPPFWLVAVPWNSGSLWAAVMEDGRVQAFSVEAGSFEPVDIQPAALPPGQPPLLIAKEGQARLLAAPSGASSLSSPIPLPGGEVAYVDQEGRLVFLDSNGQERAALDIHALPDARLLSDQQGQVLVLGDATERYSHGALGDGIEAGGVYVVASQPEPAVSLHIELEDGQVVEGLAPLWAHVNGDSRPEIILTVSDALAGARVIVHAPCGKLKATGPAAGQGNRWRHVLVVAPFGPHGEIELAEVLTPHLDGRVGFYRPSESGLSLEVQAVGYSTHQFGSRNLDTALAGDLDGDGRVELLVPRTGFRTLAALRHTEAGVEVAWELPLEAEITSNLAGAQLNAGGMAVGVGLADGRMLVWSP